MQTLTALDLNSQNYSRIAMDNSTREDKKNPQKNELFDQCREFESVLINSMLQSMRNTVEKSDLFSGGKAEEIYTSMLDEQYSLMISKNSSTGLAEELYRQVARDYIKNNKNQEELSIVNKLM